MLTKDSPLQKSHSDSQSASIAANAKLSLLYQFEQRKVAKLERENRALRERINNLLSKEDEERIELLVADKTRRKLAQLRAITERTIKSLESGLLNEFRTFVDDLDDALEEQEEMGALQPLKLDPTDVKADRILRNFTPRLKRIPESPLGPSCSSSSSVSKLNTILNSIEQEDDEEQLEEKEENETVEETSIFEEMEVSGVGKENAKDREEEKPKGKEAEENKADGKQSHQSRAGSVTIRQSRSNALKPTHDIEPVKATVTPSPGPAVTTPLTSSVERMSVQYQQDDIDTLSQFSSLPSSATSTPLSMANASITGRAKRNAAAKIGSYKLPSLNKKMRRE